MKITIIRTIWMALLLSSYCFAFGQKLQMTEQDLPISKEAKKKGMYVITNPTSEGQLRTFIAYDLKKGDLGFDIITMDKSGQLVGSASEVANAATAAKYDVTIPDPGTVENPAKGKTALRLVSASGIMGSMKIEKGYFEPVYATSVDYGNYYASYTKVLRGFKFVEQDTYNSDTKINIMATLVDPEEAIQRNYSIIENAFKIGTVGFFMEDSKVAFVGKDARLDKSSPYAQNVLVSGQFNGRTRSFDNLQQIVLDYNCQGVTSGMTAAGDLSVLVAALNAPTTISEHKKWQADGKQLMTLITVDQSGQVKENVSFESKSIRGNFGVYGQGNANYVVGSVNSGHSGYYRWDIGKATDFQVVKVADGKVVEQTVASYEDLAGKIVTPGGGKAKLKLKDIHFTWYEQAPNGDMLAFASTNTEYLIFQIGADAEVKALYLIGRVPGKEFFELGPQVLVSGEDMYVLFREQSGAITQGVSKSFSRGAGYAKNVNFSRVDELMTYGRAVKINATAKTCSEAVDFNSDVILGDKPMFLGDGGALLMPVRDTKRNYKLVKIQ